MEHNKLEMKHKKDILDVQQAMTDQFNKAAFKEREEVKEKHAVEIKGLTNKLSVLEQDIKTMAEDKQKHLKVLQALKGMNAQLAKQLQTSKQEIAYHV